MMQAANMSTVNAATLNMSQHQAIIRDAHPNDVPQLTEIYNYYVLNSIATFEEIKARKGQRKPQLSTTIP